MLLSSYFGSGTLAQGLIIADEFSRGIQVITIVASICIFISMIDYLKKDRLNLIELPTLLILSVFSSILLIGSNDLLTFYLAIEMQSLCFYVLASLKRNSSFSTEAGLKYFVLGAFSSGLLLFGCSLVYGFLGTTNLEEICRLIGYINPTGPAVASSGFSLGILFILFAFMFKIAAAPFHVWIPDVYEGSPICVTAYFSIVPKLAILGLCVKICLFTTGVLSSAWQVLIIFCSLCSLILGCSGALHQRKVKRLLAYSSIVHAGFLLLAIGSNSILGVESLLFYMLVYIIMGLGLFAFLISIRKLESSSRVVFLTELSQFAKVNPVLCFGITLILFSMAGVPPLAGFFSKMNLFLASLNSELYLPTIIALSFSAITAVYYIRVIKIFFFDKRDRIVWFANMDKSSTLIVISSVSFISSVFLYPDCFALATSYLCLSL
jgi:NADH-quinone oxidoreductase subunit N